MNEKIEIISGSWNRVKNWVNKRIRIKATGNLFVGEDAGLVTSGNYNNFMGYQAGYSNVGGHSNNFMGYQAGYSNTTGHSNNFMGYQAGYSNITGVQNVFIGLKAGYFEKHSNMLFIDNAPRANEADARVKALIYGLFEATTAAQLLRINGILELTEITNYANNAAAITGGLTAGQVYKNGDSLNIVH